MRAEKLVEVIYESNMRFKTFEKAPISILHWPAAFVCLGQHVPWLSLSAASVVCAPCIFSLSPVVLPPRFAVSAPVASQHCHYHPVYNTTKSYDKPQQVWPDIDHTVPVASHKKQLNEAQFVVCHKVCNLTYHSLHCFYLRRVPNHAAEHTTACSVCRKSQSVQLHIPRFTLQWATKCAS